MDVKNTLTYIMREENLNATELCEKTNIPHSSLSDYLSGKVSPRFKTFCKMVNSLNYDVVALTPTGKVYKVKDISSCFKHIRLYSDIDLKTLSANSGITTNQLYNLILGRNDPTIRTINSILASSGYSIKIKKRSKK